VELLAGMSAEDRRQVLASGRRRRFAPREVVFHEGDPADTFLLIEVGRMAVRAATPLGDTVTFAVVGPGEVVGELALLDEGARRSASVVALEATEAWSFTAETFHRLRRTNAGASRATVNRVLRAVAADGLLELRRGRIVVLDPAGLTRRGSAGF
jgi:CRP-like cAMP-binding protein